MKRIVDKYDKQLIADLPRVLFPGHIEIIVSESDAERAVRFLMKQTLLGFDTESRPSFVRGKQYKVSLLQISTTDVCFLFRLNRIGLPKCLVMLLEDKKITKVGLSWHDDLHMLAGRNKFQPGIFVELQSVAEKLGIQDKSLQKLYANIFGKKISKSQRLSNWEAESLTEAQKQYAATDAWACIQLYNEMKRMQEEGYDLVHSSESIVHS